MYIMLSIKLT